MKIMAKEDAAQNKNTSGGGNASGSANAKGPQAETVPPTNETTAPSQAEGRQAVGGAQSGALPEKTYMTPQMIAAKAIRVHAAGLFKPGGDTYDSVNPDVTYQVIRDEEGEYKFFDAKAINENLNIGDSVLNRQEYGGPGNLKIWHEYARTLSLKWTDSTKDNVKGKLVSLFKYWSQRLCPQISRDYTL